MEPQFQLQYWMERVALFDDQFAYEKLFFHYNDGLYNLSFSFVRSEQVAEEIVSDVFVNIWRNRARLLEIENLKVYLYVSVKNLSVKHLSRTKEDGIISLEDILVQNVSGTSSSPEDLLVSKEVINQLTRAIEDLPPKCKLIFKLVREHGMKYKEIAQLLNISIKTIDAQMAIAGKKISQSLHFLLKK